MTQDVLNIGENAVCPSLPPVSALFHILFDFHPNHVKNRFNMFLFSMYLTGKIPRGARQAKLEVLSGIP